MNKIFIALAAFAMTTPAMAQSTPGTTYDALSSENVEQIHVICKGAVEASFNGKTEALIETMDSLNTSPNLRVVIIRFCILYAQGYKDALIKRN